MRCRCRRGPARRNSPAAAREITDRDRIEAVRQQVRQVQRSLAVCLSSSQPFLRTPDKRPIWRSLSGPSKARRSPPPTARSPFRLRASVFTTSATVPSGEGAIALILLSSAGHPPEDTCFQDAKQRRSISPTQVTASCQVQRSAKSWVARDRAGRDIPGRLLWGVQRNRVRGTTLAVISAYESRRDIPTGPVGISRR